MERICKVVQRVPAGKAMRLRGRILIAPRSYSPVNADEARLFVEALTGEWNVNGRPKMEVPGAIVLYKDSSQYDTLRALFLARAKDIRPDLIVWHEVAEAVYSESELQRGEILALHINGEAGLGGNAYANVYDLATCPSCGGVKIARQLRDPVVDLRKSSKDFASTLNFSERIVSSRLKSLLEEENVAGLEFKAVAHAHPSRPVRSQYFQLLVHNVLSPLLAPKHHFRKRCGVCGHEYDAVDQSPERPDPWTEIHYLLSGPWTEMHFPRSSYKGWDLMRTEEIFGGRQTSSDLLPPFSQLLISQRLFGVLRRHKITGFWVEPAHLDPASH